jgi:Replication-relaxation
LSEKPRQQRSKRFSTRDKEIITTVYQFRVAREDQLQTLFFGSKTRTYAVLTRLVEREYLAVKHASMDDGRTDKFYVLAKRGADFIKQTYGEERVTWYASYTDLKRDFLAHTTAINDFRLSILKAVNTAHYQLTTWLTEADMKRDYDRVQIEGVKKPISLIPDGYFVLNTPEREIASFLEVDRGTEKQSELKQKVQAYLAYRASGAEKKRYEKDLVRVVFVVKGVRRLENLKKTAEEVGAKGRFYFVLADDLRPETVLSTPIWSVGGKAEKEPFIR